MKRITVVVNKNWETEGVMAALVNTAIRPQQLPFPSKLHIPNYTEKTEAPRALFSFGKSEEPDLTVTVRCIQDSMYINPVTEPSLQSGSSSEEKLRILPAIFENYDKPDLVISVSTAGYPSDFSVNGSVVVGGNFFIHSGNDNNPKSKLKHPDIGKFLENNVNPKLYGLLGSDFKNSVEPKFLRTPNNPCEKPCCIASRVFTALSVINVTEYEEYNWADHEAMEHYDAYFKKGGHHHYPCNSSETTHGVVKFSTKAPIIFVSPITDQFGRFDFEVTATQNFAASFNAGIVIGHLLCELNKFSADGNIFGK